MLTFYKLFLGVYICKHKTQAIPHLDLKIVRFLLTRLEIDKTGNSLAANEVFKKNTKDFLPVIYIYILLQRKMHFVRPS